MKKKTQLEHVATDSLIPFANNSRTHSPEQVAQIAGSIREFGFTNPVLIDADNGIIAGHGRVMAAQKLGLEEVPCIRLGYLTDAQKRAYVIADNKLALNAGWNEELLRVELKGLEADGFDLGLTGFSKDELNSIMLGEDIDKEGLTDDDEAPGLEKDATSKDGDLWIMGGHRVLCGDCTSATNIERLMDGQSADGCWTDPPYNVNYEGSDGKKIANDSMSDEKFAAFLYDAYVSMFMAMKEGAGIYVAHADTEGLNFRKAFRDAGFKLSGCLIWVKNALVLGRSDYQWRHEPILYGWKPGVAHSWFGGRANTTVIEASKDLPLVRLPDGRWQIDMGSSQIIISGSDVQVEEVKQTVIRAEKPKKNGDHPTMKPVDLIIPMLKNSTKRGAIILDLFGGSGSTLIACEKTGRIARCTELEPRYCDVIVKRWQDFTGKKAVHESGKTFEEMAAMRKA